MTGEELKKKETKPKRSSARTGKTKPSTFPTLGRIVLSNGLVVEIPKLPTCTWELTTFDHLRIALDHAAIILSTALREESRSVPKLMLSSDWEVIRLNSEDLLNHLHYAIEGYPKEKGSS